MTVTVKSFEANTVKIGISGRFDCNLHRCFRDAYRELPRDTHFLVDFSETDYLDSSGLGMLLLLREFAGGENSRITIAGCCDKIKRILDIANFDKLFTIR
jgi:anti-anti-sigma factor